MLIVAPSASIPIVQVSVLANESPSEHFRIGQALAKLRVSNVAIVASGFATFHNMRLFFSTASRSTDFRRRNDEWSEHVSAAVSQRHVDDRRQALAAWRDWPGSFDMHPRGAAEHFLPLIVAAGAGGEGHAKSYKDNFLGLDMFSYYWE